MSEASPSVTPLSRINGRIVGISVGAALGGFLFGFDTSVINGAVTAIGDQFSLSAGLQGFAVSSALLGCAVGAWFAGPIANKMGRIPVMLVAALLFLVALALAVPGLKRKRPA